MTIAAKTAPLLLGLAFFAVAGTGFAKTPEFHDQVTTELGTCWSTTERIYTETKHDKTKILGTQVLSRVYDKVCAEKQVRIEKQKGENSIAAEKARADAALKKQEIDAASQLLTKVVSSDMPPSTKAQIWREIVRRLDSSDAAVKQSQNEANILAGLSDEFIKAQMQPPPAPAQPGVTCAAVADEKGAPAFTCN